MPCVTFIRFQVRAALALSCPAQAIFLFFTGVKLLNHLKKEKNKTTSKGSITLILFFIFHLPLPASLTSLLSAPPPPPPPLSLSPSLLYFTSLPLALRFSTSSNVFPNFQPSSPSLSIIICLPVSPILPIKFSAGPFTCEREVR